MRKVVIIPFRRLKFIFILLKRRSKQIEFRGVISAPRRRVAFIATFLCVEQIVNMRLIKTSSH